MTAKDHINNDPTQIKIRKYQSNLIIMGTGVIALGFWAVIETIVMLTVLRNETVEEILLAEGDTGDRTSVLAANIVFITVTLMILAVVLAIRFYIGRSAIAEGRGTCKRSGVLYLLLTVMLIIFSIVNVIAGTSALISSIKTGVTDPNVSVSSVLIELTSGIVMTETVISAIGIRILRAKGKHSKAV